MTNTTLKDKLSNRLYAYLYGLTSHLIFFSAIIICAALIHNPALLQKTFFLSAGVLGFLISFAFILTTLERSSCVFIYNRKTFRENPLFNDTATKLLYFTKNICLILSNIFLFSSVIFLFVHTPSLGPQLFLSFLLFHILHLLKDYFNSSDSCDFLSSLSKLS